jgi:hypothetical protein
MSVLRVFLALNQIVARRVATKGNSDHVRGAQLALFGCLRVILSVSS